MAGESQLKGLQRILAREVNVSDLLQHLTELDSSPWEELVGFIPESAGRELKLAKLSTDRIVKGTVDLALGLRGGIEVAIEVKLGHGFSADQQERYEKSTEGRLILAGMEADRHLVRSELRWEYLNLADIFHAWVTSSSQEASVLAVAATKVIREWDASIESVFRSGVELRPLVSVSQKFLAVVIARRIADELEQRGLLSWAGVTSGSGGLAIVQAWTAIRDDPHRRLTAEVRWHEGMKAGELRLGVDYFLPESPQARAEAWELAKAMDNSIRIDSLRVFLAASYPQLDSLMLRTDAGRKAANDEKWQPVVEHGFKSRDNPTGVEGGRTQSNPGFVGDGTQRFEAVGKIDFSSAMATDVIELIEVSVEYLRNRLPRGYT